MADPQPDTQDSSAPIPYIDMGREGSSMPYMPESSGKKKSMDDLAGNINYDAILKADKDAVEEKIGRDKANDDAEKRRDEQYRSRQERMISAEGATMDDIKPWDAEKELAKHKTGLWEQFGSPGFIVSMLASAFTAQPMNSALTSGAAAMNAINQGDMEGYNKAFDAYKENTSLALKRIDLEKTQYEQIEKLRTSNMAEWRAQAEAIAARFNDTRMLAMLRNGADPEAMQVLEKMGTLQSQLSDAHANIVQNDIRMKLFNSLNGTNKDPTKMAQYLADAERIMKGGGAEDQAINTVIAQPNFRDKSSDEQQKLLDDAVAKVGRAKFKGYGAAMGDASGVESQWEDAIGRPISPSVRAVIENTLANKDPQKAAALNAALEKVKALAASGASIDDAALSKIIADATEKAVPKIDKEALDNMGWTQRAIDAAAKTYNKTGRLPTNLGSRQYAGMISGAVQDRAAELLEEEGKSVADRVQDWQKFSTQRVAQNRFLSGPQGNTIRSLNVVVSHLQVMQDLSAALKNGDITRFNAIAQQWAEETGDPAPTNFDTAKQIVGAEIIKALGVAGAGTESERSEAADSFNRARSPEAITGSIGVARRLLVGQLEGLRRQFKSSTGLPITDFDDMLDPQTKLFFGQGSGDRNAPQNGPLPSGHYTWSPQGGIQ